MAHNLNYNETTGQHSFFSVKQKAWHGLGKIVEDYPTSAEAIQHAGLDFTVEKRPLFTYDSENHHGDPDVDIIIPEVDVPGYYATVRTDNDVPLGVVGEDYEIIQNSDAFSFFDTLVGDRHGIKYETAGALGKGERIFITAKLPDCIRVGREDLIEQYIFLTTSHNGCGSITAAITPVRIVCNNTLNAAMKNYTHVIKIRHTTKAKDRLMQAYKVWEKAGIIQRELDEVLNTWAKITVTDAAVKRLVQMAMVPNKEVLGYLQQGDFEKLPTQFINATNAAYEYAMSSPTQQLDTTRNTLFGVYNGITGYYQNIRDYKSSELKLKSLLYGGTAQQRGQAAFDLCTSFALHRDKGFQFN